MNVPGDQDQDEHSDPNQADVRVLDSFNPNEPLLQFLREQGVTVIHATPGRVNVIAGQSGIFRTFGRTAEQMTVRFPAGILVNLGEVPKQAYTGKLPSTRMGTASLVRTALVQAQNDAHKRATAKDPDKQPARNLKLEALEQALDRKVPVIFSAHRADDLGTALRLAKEFRLAGYPRPGDGGLSHRAMRSPRPRCRSSCIRRCSASARAWRPTTATCATAALLAERKIPLAIGTSFEGYVPKTRVLRHEAAVAHGQRPWVRAGAAGYHLGCGPDAGNRESLR